jgi:hypothetical protein
MPVVNADGANARTKAAIERTDVRPDDAREEVDVGLQLITETCGSVGQRLKFLSGRLP